MAYLKYRGLTTTPTKPNAITAAGVPLTNAEIDGNLASLNDMKLENSGYVPGNIVYADTNGTLVPLAVPTTDGAV